eukprot:m.310293 g.310293  ORF g.310293 m.310293 type:complete len:382 (+) comp50683_c0_seq1:690-1835(+)
MAVVIDLGSGTCKAGFNTDESPPHVFPSAIGDYEYLAKCSYVGKHAAARMAKPAHLKYKRPMVNGRVDDWDGVESLLEHVFTDVLDAAADEHAVCLANFKDVEPTGICPDKITQILFEKFRAPAVYMPPSSASMVLFALGKTEGLVIELGHGINVVSGYYEGCNVGRHTSQVAGGEITEFLAHLLNKKGHSFYSTHEIDLIRQLKESHAGVSSNFNNDATLLSDTENQPEFTFPDTGKVIRLGPELLECTEILFEPHGFGTFGLEMKGIHEMAIDCIKSQSTQEMHDVLSSNIILTGGTSLLPGMKERLEADVLPAVGALQGTKIIAEDDRAYLAWRGAALYASKDDFVDLCATKKDYDETGPKCIKRKCSEVRLRGEVMS